MHGRPRRYRGKKSRSGGRRCILESDYNGRRGRTTRSDGAHCTSPLGVRNLIYSRIVGTGSHLPEKVLTNFDLEKLVDTSDAWIRERTGIERRHIAAEGETTVDLAEHAARRALESAGLRPEEVDFIAFGTTTPDLVFPNCGVLLQGRLGIQRRNRLQRIHVCAVDR